MGRRYHCLPAAHDRFPELHAQPRGGCEGAGGRDRLCRAVDAARGARRPLRLRPRAAPLVPGSNRQRSGRGAARRRAARAHDSGRGRHATQHRARPRGAAAPCDRRQVFPGVRRERLQGHPRAHHQAVRRPCAHERACGRSRHQLLRRSASLVCRQRGQGDGERQAGLSRGQPDAGAATRGWHFAGDVDRSSQRRAATRRARGQPAHAHHRRGRGARPDGRARLRARTILPAAELRDILARRRRHPPHQGGARADRRRGRSRARLAVDDRARNGRLVRPVRAACVG